MSINVLFLDIDGVVNTPMWTNVNGKLLSRYNFPKHGKVNNWQACQWVSRFCLDKGYSIVITSTWRDSGLDVCKKCLYDGGISKKVPIIGMTPRLPDRRGEEIDRWLRAQLLDDVKIKRWIIVDDIDDTITTEQSLRLVLCRPDAGFLLEDFMKAKEIHDLQNYYNYTESRTI